MAKKRVGIVKTFTIKPDLEYPNEYMEWLREWEKTQSKHRSRKRAYDEFLRKLIENGKMKPVYSIPHLILIALAVESYLISNTAILLNCLNIF